jgi:hypothetical protein
MRTVQWVAALVLGVGLASPAFAQRTNTFGGNPDPALIRFEPIFTGQSNVAAPVPIAQPQFFPRQFNLANILPSISGMTNKRVVGMSNYPSADGMPGLNYLRLFGYHRAQPVGN